MNLSLVTAEETKEVFALGNNDLHHMKGHGQLFAEFVDRLIQATAYHCGVPQNHVRCQLRANIKDGGVDTQIDSQIPSPQGWFSNETFWQYKSVEGTDIDDAEKTRVPNDLQAEIRNKPYAKGLISRGYGMRFCILGDLTPQKVAVWEAQLLKEAQSVNPNASPPRVVHGEHLRGWAESFPSIVQWLGRTPQVGITWKAWEQERTSVTGTYVRNPDWIGIETLIADHVDFTRWPKSGVLRIGGEAGVGKSRLVYESLRSVSSISTVAIVTGEGSTASVVVDFIANQDGKMAVLIADECTEKEAFALEERTKSLVARLRIIAIGNTLRRPVAAAAEIWLTQEKLSNLEAILDANRPHVPASARRSYAQLAKGFVRLAVDMCDNHDRIIAGDFMYGLASIESYVTNRLISVNALDAASSVALFERLGFRDDVAAELDTLSGITGISLHTYKATVTGIRESPGFVVQAGRFWYVSPQIVAQILFAHGWRSWVEPSLACFIAKLTPSMSAAFQGQARRYAGKEARDQVTAFFSEWRARLRTEDLIDPSNMQILEMLMETSPGETLGWLAALLKTADDILVRRLDPSRRRLVWLLEKLVGFRDLFHHGEECLFRLAQCECERGIGNNATEIWKCLFSVFLSGTEVPFLERFVTLKRRLHSSSMSAQSLSYAALRESLNRMHGRVLPPPLIAGRIRPVDWAPQTREELRACYDAVFGELGLHSREGGFRRSEAIHFVTDSISFLIQQGYLSEVVDFFRFANLQYDERRQVFLEAESVLHDLSQMLSLEKQTEQELARWVDSLRPRRFSEQLRAICSRNFWDQVFMREGNVGDSELMELSRQIMANPELLIRELDWLDSEQALSCERLGSAIGQLDVNFIFAEQLFHLGNTGRNAALLAGYVRGVVNGGVNLTAEMSQLMASLCEAQPVIAARILPVAGEKFDGLMRLMMLVQSGRVPPIVMRPLSSYYGTRLLTRDETRDVLSFLLASSNSDAKQIAIEFAWIKSQHLQREKEAFYSDEALRKALFDTLEEQIQQSLLERDQGYAASQVTRALSEFDVERSLGILVKMQICDSIRVSHAASKVLQELAPRYGAAILETFGASLLDEKEGWKLKVSVHRDLIELIPDETTIRWIRVDGEKRALAIARHLPLPFVNENGEPEVPPVTDFVLGNYPTDAVIGEFFSGSFSGTVWAISGGEPFRNQANMAKKFLNSSNPGVREWAAREIHLKESWAVKEEREQAERDIE